MSARCLICGHCWRSFHQEQCPLGYHVCVRCTAVEHACNDSNSYTDKGGALAAWIERDKSQAQGGCKCERYINREQSWCPIHSLSQEQPNG